ncbi:MAG: glyoxalase [Betaproteobacteria bacterium]
MLQNFPIYAYIPVRDVPRAREFYEGKLGFAPGHVSPAGVVYEFGGGTACFLYPTPNAGSSQASQAFWEVDDIEREVAELKRRGVTFEAYEGTDDGIATGGGARAAWFKDPDGNIMAVVQSD